MAKKGYYPEAVKSTPTTVSITLSKCQRDIIYFCAIVAAVPVVALGMLMFGKEFYGIAYALTREDCFSGLLSFFTTCGAFGLGGVMIACRCYDHRWPWESK